MYCQCVLSGVVPRVEPARYWWLGRSLFVLDLLGGFVCGLPTFRYSVEWLVSWCRAFFVLVLFERWVFRGGGVRGAFLFRFVQLWALCGRSGFYRVVVV